MILARLSRAVREQNWFAVAIEFVIVIAGVVIGFQITAWNAGRQLQAQEDAYLLRLHGEVESMIAMRAGRVAERERNFAAMVVVADMFAGRIELRDLTAEECQAVAETHILSNLTDRLPTVAEMIASGRLDTLRSDEVRAAITVLEQAKARAGDVVSAIQLHSRTLYDHHPDLIEARVSAYEDDLSLRVVDYTCDPAAMIENRAFLNQFAGNFARYDSYVFQGIRGVQAGLIDLHAALDAELGIDHAEDTT